MSQSVLRNGRCDGLRPAARADDDQVRNRKKRILVTSGPNRTAAVEFREIPATPPRGGDIALSLHETEETIMGMLSEFREFAVKGNAVDMAVGIIIGGAFGKIVTSLVNDVIMPPIGALLGRPFRTSQNSAITLSGAREDRCSAVTINYGIISQHDLGFRDCGLLYVPGRQADESSQEDHAAAGGADHQGVPAVPFQDSAEGEAMCPLHVAARTMTISLSRCTSRNRRQIAGRAHREPARRPGRPPRGSAWSPARSPSERSCSTSAALMVRPAVRISTVDCEARTVCETARLGLACSPAGLMTITLRVAELLVISSIAV